MGSANDVPCFANSTPFDVKISFYKDERQELKRVEKITNKFDANASGSYGGAAKGKIGDGSFDVSKKADIGAQYGYSGFIETESKMNYVDPNFTGFTHVAGGTRLELDYLKKSKDQWYVSIVVFLDDNSVKVISENARLPSKTMMLGFSE